MKQGMFLNMGNARMILLTIISLFLCLRLIGQNQEYLKHSIHINYGNIIISDQVSIAYEQMIYQKDRFRTKAKLNYGRYLNNNGDYDTGARIYQEYYSLSAVQLIGILELNSGLAYTSYQEASGFNPDPKVDYSRTLRGFRYYGNFGIRWERRHFLFRAGLGNLELLYLGIGFNF